jgi:hypothetical protein
MFIAKVHRLKPVLMKFCFGGQRLTMRRFMCFPRGADATGEIESMPLLAGQSAGLVSEIRPAGEIVGELVEGGARIIESF